MKQLNDYRMMLMLVGFAAAIVFSGGIARADFVFGEPVNMGPVLNSTSRDEEPGISSDGLSIYFCSQRPGGRGSYDMYVTTRVTIQDDWGPPVNLGPTVNSTNDDFSEDISADGLELYFGSNRPGGRGSYDIWVAKRATTQDDWTTPVNLGQNVNSSSMDGCPSVSDDGLELYFWSNRSGGTGGYDIWVSRRATVQDEWGPAENVGSPVNSSSTELCVDVSPDGLALTFVSARPGSYGGSIGDLWMSRRSAIGESWGPPVNLGPKVNSSGDENGPCISSDGSMLYYSSNRPGGSGNFDMWQVPIEPIVDFNGDEYIDTNDLLILMDNWNTDESLCDIGPMPWGDGVVDMQDLTVFIRHWELENFIDVDEDDNGGQVLLEQGQRLVITLESNPTTGHSWELVEEPNSILEQIGEAEFKPIEQTDPPMVGAGGWEIFRFKAVRAEQETLELIYRRSREKDAEPAKTFSIEVTVN